MSDFDKNKEAAMRIFEQQEREAMLRESAKMQSSLVKNTGTIREGYVELYFENLPSKGLFQPDGARLYIKAAKTKEILKWSSIDNADILSVTTAMNDILSTCVEYAPSSNRVGSYKELRDEDRFFILMAIRDLTFPEPENKLVTKFECVSGSCGEQTLEISLKTLTHYRIPEKYYKYYNESERCFNIQTKNFGVIKMVAPSIGVTQLIGEFIKIELKKRNQLDNSVIKILPYIVGDYKTIKAEAIKDLHVDILRWPTKKLTLMLSLIQDFLIGPDMQLKSTCEKCAQEVVAPLTFPDGLRSIFLLPNIDSELL